MPKKGPITPTQRLHRISGQISGIEKMLEEKQELSKIIIQVQAVTASLESLKLQLIKEQIKEQLSRSLEDAMKLIK